MMQLVVWVLVAIHVQPLSTEKIWRFAMVYDTQAACQAHAKIAQVQANATAQLFVEPATRSQPTTTVQDAIAQYAATEHLKAASQPEQYVCMFEVVKTMADVPK
jgi:hypothetical protein